jgi:hypothetical protein
MHTGEPVNMAAKNHYARHRDGNFRRRGEPEYGLQFIAADHFSSDLSSMSAWAGGSVVPGARGSPMMVRGSRLDAPLRMVRTHQR